jgi:hypothetical protein
MPEDEEDLRPIGSLLMDRVLRPTSTFGTPLSQADEQALGEVVDQLGLIVRGDEWGTVLRQVMPAIGRDKAIAEASGRWPNFVLMGETQVVPSPGSPHVKLTKPAPGAVPLQSPSHYFPGDVVAIRARAARVALRRVFQQPETVFNPDDRTVDDLLWTMTMARLLYGAVPYFLPAATAHGIMASVPPDPALAAEIRLPYPAVAVFFGSDLEIPAELIGGEEALDHRRPVDALSEDLRLNLPSVIRPAVIAIRQDHPVALSAVVLAAGEEGVVSDFALFIVRTPESRVYGHSFAEALLSRSRLAPLVSNLAASIAWGGWTPPHDLLELPDVDSREFRKAINRGAFRRREPRGAVAGVHVLEAPRPAPRPTAKAGPSHQAEHASPATHLRRGHWRRQRIGPRSNWQYDVRWVRPTLVNPEGTTRTGVRVYRLPIPPADCPPRQGGTGSHGPEYHDGSPPRGSIPSASPRPDMRREWENRLASVRARPTVGE